MSALTIINISADSMVTIAIAIRALSPTDVAQADTLEVGLPEAAIVDGPPEEAGDSR